MSGEPSLAELQHWMIGVLQGTDAGIPPDVDRVIAPSSTMSGDQRLDVYRRGYRLRLLECLRAMHPVLLHVLGEEVFDAFALDYLGARPSSGYSLFRLDEGFADHLAATRPEGETWPDFVIDVVRFERAFLEVYDGPGCEGESIASQGQLPVDQSSARRVTVEPAPCLRLFRSSFPVAEYVCAVRQGEEPALPRPRPSWVALVRREYVVDVVPLTAAWYRTLSALLAGADVAGAAEAAHAPEADVLEWVGAWAECGFFRRFDLPAADPDPMTTSRRHMTCS